ncbi:ABC transporter substrate-binding protein [Dyadobacter pollutisoli]|uniref:ABC transporter substrate-binding protein n=1 Tax=Dyadobacter pollutisoli TaxID=2910158 RepID=A0A9E8N9R4_9BACT|nr:ABC transporter substrate-binding protein [Dyadobacter pollutisoli]WAC10497.1 ABC transporter substrate-binding protein [Dyadobacter pollutisoli]
MIKKSFLLPFFLFIILGCNTEKSSEKGKQLTDGSSRYIDKIEVKHAKGFTIEYFSNYKILNIVSSFEKSADTLQYVLLEKDTPRPDEYPNAQLIHIPVRSLVAMSSMHVGLLDFLGATDILTGLGTLQYVYSPKVIAMIKAGKVAEIGRDQGLNEEKLVEMHPDVVMTIGSPGGKTDHYQILKQAEIPVLVNSEWIEKTPLARAEWVKLMAALLNQEKLVNEKFGEIESEYNRLSKLAAGTDTKPSVISGLNTKDAWFLPSGDGYMAQFFRDAGADYHWSNAKSSGSLSLSFESVYPIALKADYWVNVGFGKNDTRKDILAQDSRYADFNAYKTGKMFSYNNMVNEQGSNDFFESGNVNPHVVLSDLVKIFHPELLPDHELVYYKQLK